MTELEQRLGYMEKLLSHYTGYANLDSELLRNLAESVDRQQAVPQPFDAQSRGSDCLDDESFTVKPLDNNITRQYYLLTYLPPSPPASREYYPADLTD